MLKPIPEELKKQGVRWVHAIDDGVDENVILIKDLGTHKIIVEDQEDNIDAFLKGYNFSPESWICNIEEIPQPQEPKKSHTQQKLFLIMLFG